MHRISSPLFLRVIKCYCFILLLLSGFGHQSFAQELKFAPAVEFKNVSWWGVGQDGAMWWYAGQDQTAFPKSVGAIKEGRITGSQELLWKGRSFTITSVKKTDAGDIEVFFEKGKIVMGKTHEELWLIDYYPSGSQHKESRFRTSLKATKHLDGK